jgi:hypothetical protein
MVNITGRSNTFLEQGTIVFYSYDFIKIDNFTSISLFTLNSLVSSLSCTIRSIEKNSEKILHDDKESYYFYHTCENNWKFGKLTIFHDRYSFSIKMEFSKGFN